MTNDEQNPLQNTNCPLDSLDKRVTDSITPELHKELINVKKVIEEKAYSEGKNAGWTAGIAEVPKTIIKLEKEREEIEKEDKKTRRWIAGISALIIGTAMIIGGSYVLKKQKSYLTQISSLETQITAIQEENSALRRDGPEMLIKAEKVLSNAESLTKKSEELYGFIQIAQKSSNIRIELADRVVNFEKGLDELRLTKPKTEVIETASLLQQLSALSKIIETYEQLLNTAEQNENALFKIVNSNTADIAKIELASKEYFTSIDSAKSFAQKIKETVEKISLNEKSREEIVAEAQKESAEKMIVATNLEKNLSDLAYTLNQIHLSGGSIIQLNEVLNSIKTVQQTFAAEEQQLAIAQNTVNDAETALNNCIPLEKRVNETLAERIIRLSKQHTNLKNSITKASELLGLPITNDGTIAVDDVKKYVEEHVPKNTAVNVPNTDHTVPVDLTDHTVPVGTYTGSSNPLAVDPKNIAPPIPKNVELPTYTSSMAYDRTAIIYKGFENVPWFLSDGKPTVYNPSIDGNIVCAVKFLIDRKEFTKSMILTRNGVPYSKTAGVKFDFKELPDGTYFLKFLIAKEPQKTFINNPVLLAHKEYPSFEKIQGKLYFFGETRPDNSTESITPIFKPTPERLYIASDGNSIVVKDFDLMRYWIGTPTPNFFKEMPAGTELIMEVWDTKGYPRKDKSFNGTCGSLIGIASKTVTPQILPFENREDAILYFRPQEQFSDGSYVGGFKILQPREAWLCLYGYQTRTLNPLITTINWNGRTEMFDYIQFNIQNGKIISKQN